MCRDGVEPLAAASHVRATVLQTAARDTTHQSGATGLRSPTSCSTGRCAEPLHYGATICEHVTICRRGDRPLRTGPRGRNNLLKRFAAILPPSGSSQQNAGGWIRTNTVLVLSETPPSVGLRRRVSDPGWTRSPAAIVRRAVVSATSGSGGNRTPNGSRPRQFSRLRDMPVSTLPSSQISAARNDRATSGSKPEMFPLHHAELLGRTTGPKLVATESNGCSSDSESEMLPVHQRPVFDGQAPGRPIRKVTRPAALPSCESWNRTSGERV
jgi:hypothetical protein